MTKLFLALFALLLVSCGSNDCPTGTNTTHPNCPGYISQNPYQNPNQQYPNPNYPNYPQQYPPQGYPQQYPPQYPYGQPYPQPQPYPYYPR